MRVLQAALLALVFPAIALAQDFPLSKLKLPPGFKAEIWARGLPGGYAMAIADSGKRIYVGSRMVGRVYEIADHGDRRTVRVIAENIAQPSAITFADGDLYVFASDRVLRFADIEEAPNEKPAYVTVRPDQAREQRLAALPAMKAYTGAMFPREYQNSFFVARNGVRNEGKLLGFDIVNIRAGVDCNDPVAVQFLSGFVEPGESKFWGVPAHVVQAPDGALLVTDEQLGAIYRITYQAPRATKK